MKTSADPSGRIVQGTLNNWAGGVTPWGALPICEENFNYYFSGTADETVEVRNEVSGVCMTPDEAARKTAVALISGVVEPLAEAAAALGLLLSMASTALPVAQLSDHHFGSCVAAAGHRMRPAVQRGERSDSGRPAIVQACLAWDTQAIVTACWWKPASRSAERWRALAERAVRDVPLGQLPEVCHKQPQGGRTELLPTCNCRRGTRILLSSAFLHI